MTVMQTVEPFFEILCDDDSNFTCNNVISHLLARQKEEAMGSITEVVQTVKDPKSIIRGKNDDTATIMHEEPENLDHDFVLPKSVEPVNAGTTPGRQTPLKLHGDNNNMSRFSSYEERNNKSSRKSGITPLKGYFVYYLFFKYDP
jgi:phototropin